MAYSSKLGLYLAANYPTAEARSDGQSFWIEQWDEANGPQPTPEAVEAWQPSPVPGLAAVLGGREAAAAASITQLKAAVAVALMAGGMSQSDTMAAGSELVLSHAARIQAYILAGGNPVAKEALVDEIAATPPAWWSPAMLALFEAGL